MKRGGKVAVELAAGKDGIDVAGPIKLELIYAVVAHHREANVAESRVILRSGERVTAIDDLVSSGFSERNSLLLRPVIAAPWRHPDAGAGAKFGRCLTNRQESVGETVVESPKRFVVVPAVVKQKRIELDAALFRQFPAEGIDAVQSLHLIIGTEIAEVVPGVVVQKCTIGMGPLALEIRKKIAPHLPRVSHTDHRRVDNGLACVQRQIAIDPRGGAASGHLAVREWVLKPEE